MRIIKNTTVLIHNDLEKLFSDLFPRFNLKEVVCFRNALKGLCAAENDTHLKHQMDETEDYFMS